MEKLNREDYINACILLGLGLTLLAAILTGCQATASGRPKAERIVTTEVGYVCFIVRDENGVAVGGSCVQE